MNNSILSIDRNGARRWSLPNGDLHREDGPAYEGIDGFKSWWINGRRHREDGPAIIAENGEGSWWFNGNPADPLTVFIISNGRATHYE